MIYVYVRKMKQATICYKWYTVVSPKYLNVNQKTSNWWDGVWEEVYKPKHAIPTYTN